MSKFCRHQLVLLWLLFFAGASWAAAPLSTDDLVSQGDLTVNAWITPQGNIAVTQRVTVTIEVATSGWFAGSSQIELPEFRHAIVLRPESFAVNSTRRERGKTWTVQRLSFHIYPQRAGVYRLDALTLDVSVALDAERRVSGELRAAALAFNTSIPDAMTSIDSWVASADLKVQETYSRALSGLKVGDAIERKVVISASDLPSMMLPPLGENLATEGLAVYRQAPALEDRASRGDYRALRLESTTYLIEKPGLYQLPEQVFSYWDTAAGELRSALLPGQKLQVEEPPGAASTLSGILLWLLPVLLLGVGSLALFLYRSTATAGAERPVSAAAFNRYYRNACAAKNYPAAVRWLYQWFDWRGPPARVSIRLWLEDAGRDDLLMQFDSLMSAACHGAPPTDNVETLLASCIQLLKQQQLSPPSYEPRGLNSCVANPP